MNNSDCLQEILRDLTWLGVHVESLHKNYTLEQLTDLCNGLHKLRVK